MSRDASVLVFGTFDPLHVGHHRFFHDARQLGSHLTVVVARDSWVRAVKHRDPREPEEIRQKRVAARPEVDVALLGDEWPSKDAYRMLGDLPFDILAVGYDQRPGDAEIQQHLHRHGRPDALVVRLEAYQPERYKSSKFLEQSGLFDLHLHSNCSDGDLAPAEVVRHAAERGLAGISLTDHNGVWGLVEAAHAAADHHLLFLEGIEVSARWRDFDVHVLGDSQSFNRPLLHDGLRVTREGYEQRAQDMVRRCHDAGFTRVSFAAIADRRRHQDDPVFGSYDVGRELMLQHGLDVAESRKLVTTGGVCHVPYGDWALSVPDAVRLLNEAGGIAVLAHPGLIELDAQRAVLDDMLRDVTVDGLYGLEVYHSHHDTAMISRLERLIAERGWLATGGSDWHGSERYPRSDEAFGLVGLSLDRWQAVLAVVNAATA